MGYEFRGNDTLVVVVAECTLHLFGHFGCFARFLV